VEQEKLVEKVGKCSRAHSENFLKKIYLNEKTFRDRGSGNE
tara:strand:+ start:50 stop:172 length:123 start_codon:yes stop_codon:yes gene_type:complete